MPTGPRRRVLVVEDNLDVMQTTTALLRAMGQEVEFAINGYAAVTIARVFKPEIVLLDIGLPGLDGFEVCAKLRAEPALKNTRIIALSGYGDEETRKRAVEAGCDMHIVKPASVELLAEILAK